MMSHGKILAGALAALTMMFCAASGGEDCKLPLVRIGAYPMTFHPSGLITIPIDINGKTLRMMVDTGAYYSGLRKSVTEELGMRLRPLRGVTIIGFDKMKSDTQVIADTMRIGHTDLLDRPLIVFPDDFLPDDIDGILGSEILTALDVDFDYANGKLSFFLPKHCEGRVVYWTDPAGAAVLPFRIDDNRSIRIMVTLDGEKVDAILDSGSTDTVLSMLTANFLFNVNEDELEKSGGKHAFKMLGFEGVGVSNPAVSLLAGEDHRMLGGFGVPKMLIGENVLRALHLYIAYKEKKIYITPAVVTRPDPQP